MLCTATHTSVRVCALLRAGEELVELRDLQARAQKQISALKILFSEKVGGAQCCQLAELHIRSDLKLHL